MTNLKSSVFFLLVLHFAAGQLEPRNISIECTYSKVYHIEYELIPTCTLKNNPGITQPDWTVVSANNCGTSTDDRGSEVNIFYAVSKVIQYIPRGLTTLFTNIWGLRFDNTQLKYISKEDLKEFKNLKMFISYLNHIEYLERDLFIYNTQLEMVNFRSNRIRYIDPKIFDHLKTVIRNLVLDGTAIVCGFRAASSNYAANTQIALLNSTSACGKIENAPPSYILWLKYQEKCKNESNNGSGEEPTNECQDEIDAKEQECEGKVKEVYDEFTEMLACCKDPTKDCVPNPNLPGLFFKKYKN